MEHAKFSASAFMLFVFCLAFTIYPTAGSARNADISYWSKNVSEIFPEEDNRLGDYNAEIAISGNTGHLLWMADSAWTTRQIYHRRSTDGGSTWEPRQSIYLKSPINDLGSSGADRRLAVDGNYVHVVLSGTGHGNTWFGILIYLRSTDGGLTFEDPRILFTSADAWYVTNTFVSAKDGQVAIVFRNQCNWLVDNGGFLLLSEDNGANFSSHSVYSATTGSGYGIGDFCYEGDNFYVLYSDSYYYYGLQWGNLYLAASNDGGVTFNSQLISVPSANENHKTYPFHDWYYSPKLAASGDHLHVIWSGEDETGATAVFTRSSADGGQNFGAAHNLTQGQLPGGLAVQNSHETIAAKGSYVYTILNTTAGRIFFANSLNAGQSYEPLRCLSKPHGTRYVDGGWWPQLQVDPLDASGASVHLITSWFTHDYSTDGGQTFHGPALISPHFSWRGAPRNPQFTFDETGRLHVIQGEGSWSYYQSTGYSDGDVFYRRLDLTAPDPVGENQALQLGFMPYPYDDSGLTRYDNMHVRPHDDLKFTSALTAEMWVKTETGVPGNTVRLMAKENQLTYHYSPQGYQLGLHWWSEGHRPNGGIMTADGQFMLWGGEEFVPGVWMHLAMTYDAGGGENNLRLYVNGELSAAMTATGDIVDGDGILFIGPTREVEGMVGQVDEIRLWNRPLDQIELQDNLYGELTGAEPGLTAYYPLNGTTRDMTGHGHDGILMYQESFVYGFPLAVEDHLPTASEFRLWQNYPNPFNPATAISFQLSAASRIDLSVYNTSGQLVKRLGLGNWTAGRHEVVWDGTNSAGLPAVSGIYFYRLRTDDGHSETKSMILLK